MRRVFALLLMSLFGVRSRPQSSFVVTTTATQTTTPTTTTTTATTTTAEGQAFIDKLHVRSDIRFRYARTQVRSFVKNPSNAAQPVEFDVLLPENAFVSNFTIETGGKVYAAEVKPKQEAKEEFEDAAAAGRSAGLVDAREGNVFTVRTSVAAAEKLEFALTYEELLERRLSRYRYAVRVDPKRVVDDLFVDIRVNESLPIVDLRVPEIRRSSNEIVELLEDNSVAVVEGANTSQVRVTYRPSKEQQQRSSEDGVAGEFIVEYDVDRKSESEIQVLDGYFVHFFSPDDLPVIPKSVVFVLDVSGSMDGEKLTQLKDAMVTVLDDLGDEDQFSILTFSDGVKRWRSKSEKDREALFYEGSRELRNEALAHVLELEARGGTNIYDALSEAVEAVKQTGTSRAAPIVIFLTDGQPSAGPDTSARGIREHVKKINGDAKVPIYGLAFGVGADFDFISTLALENQAFARRIYEGSDAAIQLEDFYKEICNPLLRNVTYTYVGRSMSDRAGNVPSEEAAATFYRGNEYVTVGKIDQGGEGAAIVIKGSAADGPFERKVAPCLPRPMPLDGPPSFGCIPLPPPPPPPRQLPPRSDAENFIERLWAKMTIDQLLDEKNQPTKNETEERRQKATEMALRYNFVTDVTSLVVVKPEGEAMAELTPVGDLGGGNSAYSYNGYLSKTPSAGSMRRRGPTPGLRLATNFNRIYSPTVQPVPLHHPFTTGPLTTTWRPYQSVIGSSGGGGYRAVPGAADRFFATTTTTSTTPCPPPEEVESCRLELYSQTYLRGKTALVSNTTDAFGDPLASSATSLQVVGRCLWQLFSETNFAGDSVSFREGKHESAVALGKVFRKIRSIKRLHC